MTHATSKFVFRLSSLSVACTATESSHAVTSVRLDLAIDSVDWKLVETQLGPPPGAEPKLPDVSSPRRKRLAPPHARKARCRGFGVGLDPDRFQHVPRI